VRPDLTRASLDAALVDQIPDLDAEARAIIVALVFGESEAWDRHLAAVDAEIARARRKRLDTIVARAIRIGFRHYMVPPCLTVGEQLEAAAARAARAAITTTPHPESK
jgi:hypothetical protein